VGELEAFGEHAHSQAGVDEKREVARAYDEGVALAAATEDL